VIYTVSGNAVITTGWDAWEEWYLSNNWPALPQLESNYLIAQDGSTPYFVTSTYGGLISQGTPIPYTKTMLSNYYHWTVGP